MKRISVVLALLVFGCTAPTSPMTETNAPETAYKGKPDNPGPPPTVKLPDHVTLPDHVDLPFGTPVYGPEPLTLDDHGYILNVGLFEYSFDTSTGMLSSWFTSYPYSPKDGDYARFSVNLYNESNVLIFTSEQTDCSFVVLDDGRNIAYCEHSLEVPEGSAFVQALPEYSLSDSPVNGSDQLFPLVP